MRCQGTKAAVTGGSVCRSPLAPTTHICAKARRYTYSVNGKPLFSTSAVPQAPRPIDATPNIWADSNGASERPYTDSSYGCVDWYMYEAAMAKSHRVLRALQAWALLRTA